VLRRFLRERRAIGLGEARFGIGSQSKILVEFDRVDVDVPANAPGADCEELFGK
jgi:hypothetical protein